MHTAISILPTPGSIRKGKCTGPRASACSCIPPSTYTCWLPSSSPSWVQTLTNLGMKKMGTWKPSRIKVHVEYDMRRIKFRIIICRRYNANLDAEIELLIIPSSNARLAARIPLTKISNYFYVSDSLEMNSVKTLVAKRTNLWFFGSSEWRGWCEASLEPPRKPHHFDNQNLEMESKMSSSMRFNFTLVPARSELSLGIQGFVRAHELTQTPSFRAAASYARTLPTIGVKPWSDCLTTSQAC